MEATQYQALLARRNAKRVRKPLDKNERERRRQMLKHRQMYEPLRSGERIEASFLNGKCEGIAYGLDEHLLVLAEVMGTRMKFKPKDVRRKE